MKLRFYIKHFDFGLGGADILRLYDSKDNLVDSHKWGVHSTYGLSRIPNVQSDFKDVLLSRGDQNKDAYTNSTEEINLKTSKLPGK